MKTKLLLFFILICKIINAQTSNWDWAKNCGGNNSDYGNDICYDNNSNVIVTGVFYSPTISFGSYTLTNSGIPNTFVVKYDVSGNVVWAKHAGNTGADAGWGICSDINGNIYVTGQFSSSTITFGSYTLTNTNGTNDVFVAKYDPNGNVLWAKSFGGVGGNSDDVGKSICINSNGNLYFTGYFGSSTISFGSNTLTNSNTNTTDIFLVKLDVNGNIIWAKRNNNDFPLDISTDAAGNVYLTGNLGSIVAIKYNSQGTVVWTNIAMSSGGGPNLTGYVCTDAAGSVFVTGRFSNNFITIGNYTLNNTNTNASNDIYVAKLDSMGNVIWAKKAGNISNDFALSISSDISGIYITGTYGWPITFGTYTLPSYSGYNIFVAKYDTSGKVLWAESGGSSVTGTCYNFSYGICSDVNHNVYITGGFGCSTIVFGNNNLTNADNSGNTQDFFIAKLFSPTGITEQNYSNHFFISPNPFSAQTTLQTAKPLLNASLAVCNSVGQTVKHIHNLYGQTITLRRDNLASGLYFIRLTQDNKVIATNKLVITDN